MKALFRYNVYKDGILILSYVTGKLASLASGCHPLQINSYVNDKRSYHGKDGVFRFENAELDMRTLEPLKIVEAVSKPKLAMREDFEEDWDSACLKINPGARDDV